ncbi:MAG: hypothetical protein DMF55_05645, partial [Acidobacteria bacterium]
MDERQSASPRRRPGEQCARSIQREASPSGHDLRQVRPAPRGPGPNGSREVRHFPRRQDHLLRGRPCGSRHLAGQSGPAAGSANRPMSLQAGARLGPYEIRAPLGAGGMGEVYRARDTRLKRDVAVKMLSDALANDTQHLLRFEREAQLLAAVNHPGIAAIYGIEESAEGRFLVLELVEGDTLAEKLAAGPLPIAEALELGRQIAEALEAAHGRGIVHRDLKPANVKVTAGGRVKILDFGLAKNVEPESPADTISPTLTDATLPGTVLGTPAYMSPEQTRGQTLDRATDVWSLGCVLYEMLTAILRSDPDWGALLRGTPRSVKRLLARSLEKDPSRRLRDAGEARSVLEEATGEIGRGSARSAVRRAGVGASILRTFREAFVRAPQETPAPSAAPRLSQLTFAKEIESFPAFSADGSRIAFTREVGRVRKIFVKELVSGEESQVTSGPFDDVQPAWTADG